MTQLEQEPDGKQLMTHVDNGDWAMQAAGPRMRVVETGSDDHEKRILAAELNAARLHLRDARRVQLGRTIEPDTAARANKRRLAARNNNPGEAIRSEGQVSLSDDFGRTREEIAVTVQIGSGKTYERGKEVLAELEQEPNGEQLMESVENGDRNMKESGPVRAVG